MAVTHYLDTNAAAEGNGTQGSPWKTLSYAWTRFPNDAVTLNCVGGTDTLTSTLVSSSLSASSIVIVGNWSGLNLNEACYKIKSNNFKLYEGTTAKSITFKKLLIENGTSTAPVAGDRALVIANPAILTLDSCGVLFNAASTSNYYYCLNAYGPSTYITLINTIFMVKSIASLPVHGSSKLVQINSDCTNNKISGCIFHPGNVNYAVSMIGCTADFHTIPNVRNSIITGDIAQCTATNCTYATATAVTSTNGVAASKTTQNNNFWVDAPNGNFTPKALTAPTEIKDNGVDNTALIGHSLDILGNDRNSAPAGAGWDRGPHEYGFGAPYPGIHTVTDISQIADPECIYYGQTPAIVVGNQVSHKDTTETNGWGVSIDALGFPIINSGGATGTDSFKFRISRSGTWESTDSIWTFTIGVPPFAVTSVNNGAPITADQLNVPFTGNNLGDTITDRRVWLVQGAIEVEQVQVSGSQTGGTFNATGFEEGGKLAYGAVDFKVTRP